jgi:hypothetical protein
MYSKPGQQLGHTFRKRNVVFVRVVDMQALFPVVTIIVNAFAVRDGMIARSAPV